MGRPTTPKERKRQQEAARQNAQRSAADKARSRRRLLGVVGLIVVLAMVLGTVAAVITNASSDTAESTADSSTTTALPQAPAEIPTVEPGATLTGETPCPAEDGSSPRTTQFAGPPPTCIDPSTSYQALVRTNVGDLTLHLATGAAPATVNNFVVLARYHYFDGQPFAPILQQTMAVVVPSFTGSDASPGYTLPSEVPPEGQQRGPFTVSAVPVDTDGATDGAFFITTFSNTPDTAAQPTTFGFVLDGDDTIRAINAAGTPEGDPTSAVIIESISITPSVPAG